MPLLPFLEWTQSQLSISYRASAEPQELDIRASFGKGDDDMVIALLVDYLADAINRGAAGGAEFAPWEGAAEFISGPTRPDFHGAAEAQLRWVLRLASVSPRFLRGIVETMSLGDSPRSVSIVGSAPLDQSPLSVTERHVVPWLDDPAAYLGRWAEPAFPLVDKTVTKGSLVRIKLVDEISDEIAEALQWYYATWNLAIGKYAAGSGKGPGLNQPLGPETRKKREMAFRRNMFNRIRGPSLDVLVNILSCFHHKVAPIESVEIGLV